MSVNVSTVTGHAVVIGASIGGMCAARALQTRFATVTILESDTLPTRPQGRRGTPQAWHNHSLLGAGREAIEHLFPGFTDRLVEQGGRELDPGYQAANCLIDGWAARSRSNFRMFFASRPMIEITVRDYLHDDPAVIIIEGARVSALMSAGDAITGVTYTDGGGQTHDLPADFVVDAAGRGSRAAKWMTDFGAVLDEMTLDAKVSYSSRWYRWPRDDKPWYAWLTTFPDPDPQAPPEHQYLCCIFPIEDDSYIAVMGSWGQDMPTDVPSYETAARRTRTREFSRLLEASEPLTDVFHTRSTANIWRRFDRLESPPRRFVALGDAVCAFNPIYGQGMSCAATAAVMLQRHLRTMDAGSPELPKAFYTEQAGFLRGAWTLAFSRDAGYERASGSQALPEGFRKRLIRRTTWPIFQFVGAACWEEPAVDLHFNRVFNLHETIFDLLKNPSVLTGLARFAVRRALGRTTVPKPTAPELPPPNTDFTEKRIRSKASISTLRRRRADAVRISWLRPTNARPGHRTCAGVPSGEPRTKA